MEKKFKKRNIQRGLLGFSSYWIGSIIYYMAGGGSYGRSLLASFATGALLFFIFEGYIAWKKPEEKSYEKMIDKDERLIYVRLKANLIGSYFTKIVLLIGMLYYSFNGEIRESLIPATLFVVILLVEWGAYTYYKRRI